MSKYGLNVIFTNNKIDFDYYSITNNAKTGKSVIYIREKIHRGNIIL